MGYNFDASTGEFVVPRQGKYLFMIDGTLGSGSNYATNEYGMVGSQNNYAMVDLVVNGGAIRQFSEEKHTYYHKSIIGIYSVDLNTEDVVTLENRNSNTVHVNTHYPFRFMGVLITENLNS